MSSRVDGQEAVQAQSGCWCWSRRDWEPVISAWPSPSPNTRPALPAHQTTPASIAWPTTTCGTAAAFLARSSTTSRPCGAAHSRWPELADDCQPATDRPGPRNGQTRAHPTTSDALINSAGTAGAGTPRNTGPEAGADARTRTANRPITRSVRPSYLLPGAESTDLSHGCCGLCVALSDRSSMTPPMTDRPQWTVGSSSAACHGHGSTSPRGAHLVSEKLRRVELIGSPGRRLSS